MSGQDPTKLSLPPKDRQNPENGSNGQWVSFDELDGTVKSDNDRLPIASYPPPPLSSTAQIDVTTVENPRASSFSANVETTKDGRLEGISYHQLTSKRNGADGGSATTNSESTAIDMGPGPASHPPSNDGSQLPENGKIISTILPRNQLCPWIIPAKFDPCKIPKSLVAEYITMPIEQYYTTMEMLTNDFRFRLYTTLYRRLISIWLIGSFMFLILFLATGWVKGVVLFILLLVWMSLVGIGVVGCLMFKKQIQRGLHNCIQAVNGPLLKHDLIVGIEDQGNLSCHKIAIHFIHFDTKECQSRLSNLLSQNPAKESVSATAAATQSERYAEAAWNDMDHAMAARGLIQKYSQSYVKSLMRRRIRFPSRPSEGVSEFAPAHCPHSYCLCQYIQTVHFDRKDTKGCLERFFLVDDLTIVELETPVYGPATPPYPISAPAFRL